MSLSQPLPLVASPTASDSESKGEDQIDQANQANQVNQTNQASQTEQPVANSPSPDKPRAKLVLAPSDQTQSQKELSDSPQSLSPLGDASESAQAKGKSGDLAPAASQTPQEETHSMTLQQSNASPLSESIHSVGENVSPVSRPESAIPNWDAAALRIITFLSSRINPNVALRKRILNRRRAVSAFPKTNPTTRCISA